MTTRDRSQKSKALRYVVSRRWFPQLELDVSTYLTTRESHLNITDVDVYASVPDEFLGYRAFLIDCKTKKAESAIGRALRGVMARMNSANGMCIVRARTIESDHRYTASRLGIALVTEDELENYAQATAIHWSEPAGAVGDIPTWEAYFGIAARFPGLQPAIRFSKSRYWMATDPAEACRSTLSVTRQICGELDPAKKEHLAVFGDLTALFLHSFAGVVSRVFAGYLQPTNQAELSEALLILLYGGRDSYEQRKLSMTLRVRRER